GTPTQQHICEVDRKLGINPADAGLQRLRHGIVDRRQPTSVVLEADLQQLVERPQKSDRRFEPGALFELCRGVRLSYRSGNTAHVGNAIAHESNHGSYPTGETS